MRYLTCSILISLLLLPGINRADANSNENLSPIYHLLLNAPRISVEAPTDLWALAQTINSLGTFSCIYLDWADNSTGEEGYLVERRSSDSSIPPTYTSWDVMRTLPANSVEMSDCNGLSYRRTYWYRVRAFLDDEFSDYSNQAGAKPSSNSPLAGLTAPSNLLAHAVSSTSVELEWYHSLGEAEYRIERRILPNGIFTEIGISAKDEVAFADSGLAVDSTYEYRVRACNALAQCSDYSNVASVRTSSSTTVPHLPTGLTATPIQKSHTSIRLNWNDNSNDESGFIILRSQDADFGYTEIATELSNVTTYEDTGLTACTMYYYRLKAYNGAGSSAYSQANTTTAPPPPTGSKAWTGPGLFSVHLDWDNTPCAVQYHVYYLDDYGNTYQQTSEPPGGVTDSTVDVLGVDPDVYFFYRVSAVDANGYEGGMSCTTAASVPYGGATSIGDTCLAAVGWAKSAVPVNLWGSWNNFTNQVIIGWDSVPVAWNQNGEATSYAEEYRVFTSLDGATWYDVPGSPFSHPVNPPDATPLMLTVPVLYADTEYHFKVETKYFYDGNYWWSNPATVQTRTAATAGSVSDVLPAPGVVTSKYYIGKIMVGWSTIAGATGYKVYRSTTRNSGYVHIQTFSSAVTSFDDISVQPWTDYWYKVRAMNGAVEGLLSEPEYGNASEF